MRRAALALLVVVLAPASAQDPPPALPPLDPLAEPAPASSADDAVVLPTVEVTGNALPTGIARLPVSATRVERATLRDGQYQVNLSESLGRVPGLVINNRQNYAQDLQLSLRGFGARAAFGVRGLRLYTDGIPATMPDGQGQISHFDLASAERATVLRGPFSALYGASSGGVIELTTLAPERSFAELAGAGAAFETQRYSALGALASESWSLLGSGGWFDTQGFRDHSAATRMGGQARLGGTAGRSDVIVLANAVDIDAQDPLGLTRSEWQANPEQATPNALVFDTRKTVRQSQAGLAVTTPLGQGQALRAVTWAGSRTTQQFQAIPTAPQTADTHPGGVIDLDRIYYGTDLRWLVRAGAADVALGADAEFLDEHRRGFQNFVGAQTGVLGALRRDEDNTAAMLDPYAQAHWRFADAWSALAGLRYATARFRSEDRYFATGNGDDSGAVDFEAVLPVIGARYAPGPWSAHVAASRGAETPTLNELAYRPDGTAGLNDQLRASSSNNYEIGTGFANDALRAELAVFHIDTVDEIVSAGTIATGRTIFRNAAETVRDGIEAGVALGLPTGFVGTLAYTFIDARYEEFASDNRLPGVPRHNVFAELEWRSARRALGAALEGLYRSTLSVNDAGTDAAPEYAVFNLRVTGRLPAGFEWFARADNLLDRDYVGSVIVNESNGRYFEPAPGLALGGGLRWVAGGRP